MERSDCFLCPPTVFNVCPFYICTEVNDLPKGLLRSSLILDRTAGAEMLLYLVEKVDFGHCVGGLSRMFDQQGNEPHKGVQVVVTFGSDDGCTGCWVVLLFSLRTVADLHTHLCAQAEEPCDQVVCLQDPLLMHLKEEEPRRDRH